MLFAVPGLLDSQGLAVILLGVGVMAQVMLDQAQVVEVAPRLGMPVPHFRKEAYFRMRHSHRRLSRNFGITKLYAV